MDMPCTLVYHIQTVHMLNAERWCSMTKAALISIDSAVLTNHVFKYQVIERRLPSLVRECFGSVRNGINLEY